MNFLGSITDIAVGAGGMWASQTFLWPWLKAGLKAWMISIVKGLEKDLEDKPVV